MKSLKYTNHQDDEEGELFKIIGDSYYKLYCENNNNNYLHSGIDILSKSLKYQSNINNPFIYHQLSQLYYEDGNYEEALSLHSIIISKYPNYSFLNEVIFLSACVLKCMKDYKKSKEFLQHVIDSLPSGLSPNSIWLIIGHIQEESGNKDDANISYQNSYNSSDNDDIKTRYKDGNDYCNDYKTWDHLGDLLFDLRYFSLAKDMYEHELLCNPPNKDEILKKICIVNIKEHNIKGIDETLSKADNPDKILKELKKEIDMVKNPDGIDFDNIGDEMANGFMSLPDIPSDIFSNPHKLIETLSKLKKEYDDQMKVLNEEVMKREKLEEKLNEQDKGFVEMEKREENMIIENKGLKKRIEELIKCNEVIQNENVILREQNEQYLDENDKLKFYP